MSSNKVLTNLENLKYNKTNNKFNNRYGLGDVNSNPNVKTNTNLNVNENLNNFNISNNNSVEFKNKSKNDSIQNNNSNNNSNKASILNVYANEITKILKQKDISFSEYLDIINEYGSKLIGSEYLIIDKTNNENKILNKINSNSYKNNRINVDINSNNNSIGNFYYNTNNNGNNNDDNFELLIRENEINSNIQTKLNNTKHNKNTGIIYYKYLSLKDTFNDLKTSKIKEKEENMKNTKDILDKNVIKSEVSKTVLSKKELKSLNYFNNNTSYSNLVTNESINKEINLEKNQYNNTIRNNRNYDSSEDQLNHKNYYFKDKYQNSSKLFNDHCLNDKNNFNMENSKHSYYRFNKNNTSGSKPDPNHFTYKYYLMNQNLNNEYNCLDNIDINRYERKKHIKFNNDSNSRSPKRLSKSREKMELLKEKQYNDYDEFEIFMNSKKNNLIEKLNGKNNLK